MAIEWGAWEYSGANGMRVGIDVDITSVSHSSATVKFTYKVYTQNQYSYSDGQTLTFGGSAGSGSTSFTNDDGTGAILRSTETHTYTYGGSSYGSSPGTRTFTATLSGAYNGITPSKSVTDNIPARPYAAPAAQDTVVATRVSDTSTSVTWQRNATTGEPYDNQEISRWDNVSNAWTIISSSLAGSATSYTNGTSANRRYQYRLRAINSIGYSGSVYSNFIQTTPAAPSGITAAASSTTSALISWTNNATGSNYDYTTVLEESVNGGAFSVIATIAEGTASYSRTGLTPGSIYAYRVASKSTTGATTQSAYVTSSNLQLMALPPDQGTASFSYTSDTSTTISWTNNPSTEGPYESITVQRWDNVSNTWNTVGTLSGSAVSLTDTTTAADYRYQWRVRANNAAGSSAWKTTGYLQTTPDAPSGITAKRVGTGIEVNWVNQVSYVADSTVGLRYYKDGVLQSDTITLAAGTTTYTLSGVVSTSIYKFGVKAISTVGVSKVSAWTDTGDIAAATAPNAPTALAPDGLIVDTADAVTFTWQHNPSADGSAQTKYEFQYRVNGGSWVNSGEITSGASSRTVSGGTITNNATIQWQVRTKGVSTTASAWSAISTFTSYPKPVVAITTPASTTLTSSVLNVAWTWDDPGTVDAAQTAYEVVLYDFATNVEIERKATNDAAHSVTMTTPIEDNKTYKLTVRAQSPYGQWSNLQTLNLTADFIPPAESLVIADYDADSGAVVVTLNPVAVVPGTTVAASSATIQRRLLTEDGVFGEWETIADAVTPNATVIDSTAPIAADGEYRAITHSTAPSLYVGAPVAPLAEERWLFVSGGKNFSQVCRMWGNIELKSTAARARSLHNFAGRPKPVVFVGEATEQVIDVAGLLDAESSSPAAWERLVKTASVVLLRDPLGRRIYGSIDQISLDRLNNGLYAIAFTVTEVAYP